MSLYSVDIDLTNMNTSHAQVVDLVGDRDRVLDVGCWTGDLGSALKARGATVHGFERDAESAAEAAARLDRVEVGDLNAVSLGSVFRGVEYDAIVFADVLEHVLDPGRVLKDALDVLAPDGRVVISIPNVAHGSLRMAHLQGRWRTTATGLLDATHIKFFTRQSLIQLIHDSGLRVEEFRATVADPLGVEVDLDPEDLPMGVLPWLGRREDAAVYQFQVACRREVEGEPFVVPDLVLGADPRAVHPAAHRRPALVRAWRAELAERDRIIGLEAALDSAHARQEFEIARAARAEERANRALADKARVTERNKELARDVRKLQATVKRLRTKVAELTPKKGRTRVFLGRVKRRLVR